MEEFALTELDRLQDDPEIGATAGSRLRHLAFLIDWIEDLAVYETEPLTE